MSLRGRGAGGGGGGGNVGAGSTRGGGPGGPGGPRLSTGSHQAGRNNGAPHLNKAQNPTVNRWASPAASPAQANGGGGGGKSQAAQQIAAQPSPNVSAAFPSLKGPKPSPAKASGTSAPTTSSAQEMQDRTLFVLVSLVGNTVIATTKTGQRWVGVLHSTSSTTGPAQHNDLGVTLSTAQEIKTDGTLGSPIKALVINGQDLELVEASDITLGQPVRDPAIASQGGFRTDVEISAAEALGEGEGRLLQKWSDDSGLAGGIEDGASVTSSAKAGGAWDQFATNEARFGVKTNYNEDLYTTKLDRSGQDFREKERRAERIAAEIMSQTTTNSHLAEERGQIDATDLNEEDKYGAVKRGPNAYVPPAARKAAEAASAKGDAEQTESGNKARPTVAAVAAASAAQQNAVSPKAVLAEAAEKKAGLATPAIAVKVASPTRTGGEASATSPNTQASSAANNEKLTSDFKQFVSSERQRIESLAKAQAEREKRSKLAELKDWSSNFKLKTPMPDDVASVVQRAAVGEKQRDPSLQKSLSPVTVHAQASAGAPPSLSAASAQPSPAGGAGSAASAGAAASKAKQPAQALTDSKAALSKMTIPKIPPFNPEKAKLRQQAANATAGPTTSSGTSTAGVAAPAASGASSATAANFKMSAKANAFKPFNPNAPSFAPGAVVSPASSNATPASLAAPASAPAVPLNPFFGAEVFKKPTTPLLHVREDFNPFKTSKVPEASTVTPMWPYNGKNYKSIYSQPASSGQNGTVTAGSTPSLGAMQHHGQPPPQPYGHQGGPAMQAASPNFEATGSSGPNDLTLAGPVPQTPASAHSHPSAQHPGQLNHGATAATAAGLPLSVHPGHPGVHQPHAGPSGPGPVVQPQPGQPFNMMYQTAGPYRFPPQNQYVVQGMPMGPHGGPAGHMPYAAGAPGAMPHQFAMMPGQPQGLPFSPPMGHQGATGPGLYSPQMAPAAVPGPGGQYVPVGGPPVTSLGHGPPAPGQVVPVPGTPRSAGSKASHSGGPVGGSNGPPPHQSSPMYYGGPFPPQLAQGPPTGGALPMGGSPNAAGMRAHGAQPPPVLYAHAHGSQNAPLPHQQHNAYVQPAGQSGGQQQQQQQQQQQSSHGLSAGNTSDAPQSPSPAAACKAKE
ncbi:unnamed protein product [Parajaminaea phylloscopi]